MIIVTNKIHWLKEQAQLHPDKTGYILPGKSISYNQFFLACKSSAEYLIKCNVKEKDNVGILAEHKYDFFVAVNALWFIGAVPVPLNTRNTTDELQYQIKQADIKFLLSDKVYEEQTSAISNTEQIPFSYLLRDKDIIQTEDFASQQESKFDIWKNALILFTSGSSGKPKAVLHTFNSLFESVIATDSFSGLSPSDIWLASLPFYHIGGFMILVRSLLAGSTVGFPASLKYEEISTCIQKINPTHISIVPTTLHRLLVANIPPNENLRLVYLGGGPSVSGLSIEAAGKGWKIVKVYGSTETCSMTTALLPAELINKSESAGKPIGANKIKIVDQSGKILGINQTGEIVILSKALFKEYYNDPSITNEKLKEGWYHTGDFGRIDEQGFLYPATRREDLIITGGENVSSAEVESAIRSNLIIEDVYVFGIEDNNWGQIVAAVIKTKSNESISKSELINYLKEKIAGYKIPKEFYFVDHIPKNDMGKVIRKEMILLAAEQRGI
jgi:O-succinylbenzoic acid--CoA ligase